MTPATRDELIRILEELSQRDAKTDSGEKLMDAVVDMLAEGYAAASATDTDTMPAVDTGLEWID